MSIKQPHDFMFMYNGRFKFPQLVLTTYFGAWIPLDTESFHTYTLWNQRSPVNFSSLLFKQTPGVRVCIYSISLDVVKVQCPSEVKIIKTYFWVMEDFKIKLAIYKPVIINNSILAQIWKDSCLSWIFSLITEAWNTIICKAHACLACLSVTSSLSCQALGSG